MSAVREVLGFVVFLYFLVLIGRVVFDWIRIFARECVFRDGLSVSG